MWCFVSHLLASVAMISDEAREVTGLGTVMASSVGDGGDVGDELCEDMPEVTPGTLVSI